MNSIITLLIAYNQILLLQIQQLLVFIAKNIPLSSSKYDSESPKYNKYIIDKAPIIKHFEHFEHSERFDYKQLLSEYRSSNGKELKPVKSRGKNPVPESFTCPHCGAPHNYLYDNTGGRGHLLCKVCDFRFSRQKAEFKPVVFICPYCGHTLDLKKNRKHFNIHKCINKKCSFYLKNLKALSPEDLKEYEEEKSRFKLHYIYREFTLDFFKIDLSSIPDKLFSLNFRNFSPHVMGLCLTYYVNLGLSSRKTSQALYYIHGVKISHVTVSKYAKTAAYTVKPFVDNFDYKPSNNLAADETYTKVKGVRHYVWFVMDAIKKSILGYQISYTRDIATCVLAMRMAFAKFKEFPGKALKFAADGYTTYKLAQQLFAEKGMDFDLIQVIGLTNDDPVSTEYRWLKQIIERLNRTFKFSYQVTNG